ncbi:MAG: hypothetical protein IH591_01910 [Bacteroidales bacterium]|nr:hypothetical protein [Bacteroidales bacterium]
MKPASQIILITDYQNRFGTRYTAVPYRSGMDKDIIARTFRSKGYDPLFCRASQVLERFPEPAGKIFIYTSSEDRDGHYKSFLEDLILAIQTMGGIVIPVFPFLRAHNNKVFMELLRKQWGPALSDDLRSVAYSTMEELVHDSLPVTYPVVVKKSTGFKSRGVFLARSEKELMRIVRKISLSRYLPAFIKDRLRRFKHTDFSPESMHRRKFVIQQFVPHLTNDFKVLVYGDKYYVLKRLNRKNDFRASGSGMLSYPEELPAGLLDFSRKAYEYFNVPQVSLDIAHDGSSFFIMEAQFIYFGTYTIEKSQFYFTHSEGSWMKIDKPSVLEEEYAMSTISYIEMNRLVK